MSEAQLITALSAGEVEAIEAEIAHLPDRASAAIDALLIVQEKRGWISDESLAAIAGLLGMSTADLDSIATFYNLIYRRPVGKHVVMVCDSVSCYVMGCEALRGAVAAPVFPRGSNGDSCRWMAPPPQGTSTWSATPTRWSPAPSRTAT